MLIGRSIHPKELLPLVNSFADAMIAGNIRPGAIGAIARDKADGRRLILATASYRLYAAAIAERLGFDDVIATGSLIGLDGRVRSRIDGENCYGEAKKRFYSDHASDAPVFEWADEAVAVNPHARLRRLAAERGWTVADWG